MTPMRLTLIGLALAALAGSAVLCFSVLRNNHSLQAEPTKSPQELIVGSWRLISSNNVPTPAGVEKIYHFMDGGKFELRISHPFFGVEVTPGTYRMQGNSFEIFSPVHINESPIPYEVWEIATLIETIDENKLVTNTIIIKRLSQIEAERLATIRGVHPNQLIAEIREERTRVVYERVH